MNILLCPHTNEGAIFACAQAGCEQCMVYLLNEHDGLVHACIHYLEVGGVPYGEAVEEGRIGLWRAILRYDPSRQVAFSTFAWRRILGEVWRYGERFSQKGERMEEEPYEACYMELAEEAWLEAQIAEELKEALEMLPERLRGILEQGYGLSGEPPQTLAEVGRQMGVSRERVRQLRNEGLALLRLPALSIHLRGLSERDSRQAYRQARQMTNAWLRSRRRRK
jgi:RNA polymerase sigma factor (sigma-70 family)